MYLNSGNVVIVVLLQMRLMMRSTTLASILLRLSPMQPKITVEGAEAGTFCQMRNVTSRENLIACGRTEPHCTS